MFLKKRKKAQKKEKKRPKYTGNVLKLSLKFPLNTQEISEKDQKYDAEKPEKIKKKIIEKRRKMIDFKPKKVLHYLGNTKKNHVIALKVMER